jgi:excisionase family DNA binding protein
MAIVGASRNHEREHEQNARNDMSDHHSQALTEHAVAKLLGLSVATLRAWRLKSKGPRFVRFGRAVRYLADDVERFVKASVVEPSRHIGDANL